MSAVNEPLLEGQNAENTSICSKISTYLFKERKVSDEKIARMFSGKLIWLMIFGCISYTMNYRFFDSKTPGPLYEVGQTLKDEGNELYSFIDVSC